MPSLTTNVHLDDDDFDLVDICFIPSHGKRDEDTTVYLRFGRVAIFQPHGQTIEQFADALAHLGRRIKMEADRLDAEAEAEEQAEPFNALTHALALP